MRWVVERPQARIGVPWTTLALAAGSVASSCIPSVARLLLYDRTAIAEGELWRLASGHLVHHSGMHLLANLMVLIPAGGWLELRTRSTAWALYAVSMPGIGALLFLLDPRLERFGGASGLVVALLTALALGLLAERGRASAFGALILAVLFAKVGVEWSTGASALSMASNSEFVPVPLAHAAGLVAGALVVAVHRARGSAFSPGR